MKERAILYFLGIITGIMLVIMLVAVWRLFTPPEDRLESLHAIHIANIIEEKEAEGYVFDCLYMRKPNHPNYINIEDDNNVTIEGLTFITEPNEPEYIYREYDAVQR